jgi:type IV pilus assembly protein PilN
MIRINLLPVREERRKADVRQFMVLLVATFAAAVAAAGFLHWKVRADVASTQAAIVQTQRQIDQFGAQLEKVQKYRDTKAQIEKKLEVIDRLDRARSGPVHVLDELATHAPERLWITKIEAENKQISISGMSLDNERVALFLTALNQSAYFDNVELRETEAREKDGFKLNEFQLTASLTTPGEPAASEPAAPEAPAKGAKGRKAGAAKTARQGQAPAGTGR